MGPLPHRRSGDRPPPRRAARAAARSSIPLSLALALWAAPADDASATQAPDDVGDALTWDADPGCPRERFDHALARYLDGAAAGARPQLTIAARVRRDSSGWRVTLRIDDPRAPGATGERELTAARCETAAAAAAFVVAVAIDPDLVARAGVEVEDERADTTPTPPPDDPGDPEDPPLDASAPVVPEPGPATPEPPPGSSAARDPNTPPPEPEPMPS
ncbi:MAG: hypothetical protein H6713_16540 [Myxococcales bacterium]|nr:hypothetical protein [Myxococcales bacterium]